MTALLLTLMMAVAAPMPAAAHEVHAFDISTHDSASAVRAFGVQSGMQILVSAEALQGKKLNPVRGTVATDEALAALLMGTGLGHRYVGERTVALVSGVDAAGLASPATSSADTDEAQPTPTTDAAGGKLGFWNRLRLAQADQGARRDSLSIAEAGQSSESSNRIEEIVVTATRRSEGILEVPLSVVALDSEGLRDSNIKSISDLSSIVPGIDFEGQSAYSERVHVTVRGVYDSGGSSPTTGLYLDEIPLHAAEGGGSTWGALSLPIFDLDRVEVLRGPQGTLFGGSAMGGAIRFIQNQPDLQDFSGRATAELASIEKGGTSYEAGVAFGGPLITDKLGFRMTLWQRSDGGFIDRIDPINSSAGNFRIADRDANRTRRQAVRLAATWAPTEAIKITPSFFWTKSELTNMPAYHAGISERGAGEFRNGSWQNAPVVDPFRALSLTAEVDMGFGDFIAITSWLRRTGWFHQDLTHSFGARAPAFGIPDSFGNPLGIGFVAAPEDWAVQMGTLNLRQFSQQVRLSSKDTASRLAWTVGAYYARFDRGDETSWTQTPFDFFPYDGSNAKMAQDEISGFAQLDFRLFDRLTATAGVRVSRLELELSTEDYLSGDITRGETTDTPISPKLGLEYQFDSRNMVYASAAKGFRAGGVNPRLIETDQCQAQAPLGYGSDSLWSYEVGTKNRLLGDRVTLTASAYHIDWSDIQTSMPAPLCGTAATVNAGSVAVNGFDAAVSIAVLPKLQLDLSVAHTDVKFTKDLFDPDGGTVVLDGYTIRGASSPWMLTAAIEYSFQVGGRDAFFRAEDTYRGRNPGPFLYTIPTHATYNPDLRESPSWSRLNLRTGITLDRMELALFVTNALDARPTLDWDNRIAGGSFFSATTITPRTVGAALSYNF